MLHFFDYVYYRSSKFYFDNKGTSSKISGLCVIVLMHVFNVGILFFLYCAISKTKPLIRVPIILFTLIFFFLLDGVRYNKLNYEILFDKWKNEPYPHKKGALVIIYIISSSIVFFGLAIYLGTKKW